MEESGMATWLVQTILSDNIQSPWLALIIVYLVTILFTELITNNAAAVIVFPIALGVAEQLGVSPLPYIVAVMFAASASFMTPLGYQTNLMVMGPGGYRFTDYLRIGFPMANYRDGRQHDPDPVNLAVLTGIDLLDRKCSNTYQIPPSGNGSCL